MRRPLPPYTLFTYVAMHHTCARCGLVVDTTQPTHICAGDVRATASVAITARPVTMIGRYTMTAEDINQHTRQSLLGSFFAK